MNVLPNKLRVALSRLRLYSHQLRIETGRYSQNRDYRAQRICTFCNKSGIEDGYHFVLVCPVYSILRQKYIRPYYYNRLSFYKITLLMQTKQQGVLQKLGQIKNSCVSGSPTDPVVRRGSSNEYPQSMFLSRNKKKMYTPVNPSFTIYKWGLRGPKLYRHVFVMICIVLTIGE